MPTTMRVMMVATVVWIGILGWLVSGCATPTVRTCRVAGSGEVVPSPAPGMVDVCGVCVPMDSPALDHWCQDAGAGDAGVFVAQVPVGCINLDPADLNPNHVVPVCLSDRTATPVCYGIFGVAVVTTCGADGPVCPREGAPTFACQHTDAGVTP